MIKKILSSGQILPVRHLVKWTMLTIPVGLLTGSLVALFLWLLDVVTKLRWQHSWLLWLLPVAGVIIHFLYKLWGKDAERGNNLIIEEIHEPAGKVPLSMAPLVIFTTLITHLTGGSAGREGTAVQAGASMAAFIGKWLKLDAGDKRILLMTGMAAGFGGVFGTPVAGAIFALEVLAIGRMRYNALLPCLMASLFADITVSAWGIRHAIYTIASVKAPGSLPGLHFDLLLLAKVIAAGIAFGLAARFFSLLTHQVKAASLTYIKPQWLIPVAGGLIIILLTCLTGTKDYQGLGVTSFQADGISIVNAFRENGSDTFSWAWKLLFTAITLGMGFKGGEVTPLFFIGATLGNALAACMGVPADLMAGLGFIAVFAAAANTPIACTLMGAELFGGEYMLYYAIACFTAYYFSGHKGIYTAQRIAVRKHHFYRDH